jgi:hypothetical protein
MSDAVGDPFVLEISGLIERLGGLSPSEEADIEAVFVAAAQLPSKRESWELFLRMLETATEGTSLETNDAFRIGWFVGSGFELWTAAGLQATPSILRLRRRHGVMIDRFLSLNRYGEDDWQKATTKVRVDVESRAVIIILSVAKEDGSTVVFEMPPGSYFNLLANLLRDISAVDREVFTGVIEEGQGKRLLAEVDHLRSWLLPGAENGAPSPPPSGPDA